MAQHPFPVPDFDGPTIIFGAPASAYLTQEQMGPEFYGDRNRYTRAASMLFFKGGSLGEYGLQLKAGIDRAKAMGAIKALLGSFEPKHEIKIGTVGYALSQWCEDAAPVATPHQARRKKARKSKGRAFKSRAA